MTYSYHQGVIRNRMSKVSMLVIALLFAAIAAIGVFAPASAATINGCDFTESGNTWSLNASCVSSAQINIPEDTTVEGNGFTISAGFTKTSNDNNAVIGILADNVTVRDLTVDGGGSAQQLHGFNVYVAENILLENVTAQNNRSGVVVNGSVVTVENISTSGNVWHGINVDLGSGVTGPAVLMVNGTSSHTDAAHIYVDDTEEDVAVIDTESQYTFEDSAAKPNDRLYTLIAQPTIKDDCKKGGWGDFGFRNQGQCIQFVNTGRDSR